MEAETFGIGVGIQEGQDAASAIGHVRDQEIESGERGGEGVSKIAQADAGYEEDAGGDSGAGDGRAQVGLEDDQAEERKGRNDGWD